MSDCEIWIIGTPAQLDAVLSTLVATGRVVGASRPDPLHGADAGRQRRYVRLAVATFAAAPDVPPRAASAPRQTHINLADHRRTA